MEVKDITNRDVDFAKWYTDVCRKADLVDYSSVKGSMIIRPLGYAIWEEIQKIWIECLKKLVMKMYKCQCLSLSHFLMLKRTC